MATKLGTDDDDLSQREILTLRDLRKLGIPYSRWTLSEMEKRGEFPRRFRLGPSTAVGYDAADVRATIARWKAEAKQHPGVDPAKRARGQRGQKAKRAAEAQEPSS